MGLSPRLASFAAALAVAMLLSIDIVAYTTNGVSWGSVPVAYAINSTNLDLPESAVVSAVRAGADVWTSQSGASMAFAYTGPSAQTTTGYDSRNLVVFRNASNGSAIATTYYWSTGGRIIDADIVFWDGAFRFFTGSSGCANGFYVEDIAAHEFGHALGLGHSTVSGATMYPTAASCDVGNRTLTSDDIAGVEFLYGTLRVPPSTVRNVRIIR